ncbi:MAG TPA: efflux transporter outer membrane subunit [Arachidicoccus sp.]|nr:efflux transporter outer membrane subunit [Arachidicoccus sp.]
MHKYYLKYIVVLFILFEMAGCNSVVHTFRDPDVRLDILFRDNKSDADSIKLGALHWRELFKDTELQNLIAEGINNNLDLKTAYSRINQASAYLDQSRMATYPGLRGNASIDVAKTINSNTGKRNNVHQYQLGLSSSWEADIWGKLKSIKKASLASFLSSEANAKAIQTSLVAAIADHYFALMAYDKELEITLQTVETWKKTISVMKDLKRSAVVTGAAVVQSEASMYATLVTIPDLKRNIRETENAICYLLGKEPGPISRDSLSEQVSIPMLKTGVPAQLLSNRPDVQAAELDFRYAFEMTNVARTNFYPSITITANGGLTNASLGSLFGGGSIVGGIIGGLTQPIFNRGINKAKLKIAKEDQKQALYNFQNKLLNAGQEVSNALYSYKSAMDKSEPRSKQLENLNKAVDYTQELVRNDFANYSEVLIAMQSLLSAELSQVTDYLQKNQAVVNLYAALGGGWQ